MKRFLVLLLVLAAALGVMIAPVSAASIADLNALATYFPADVPFFISLRTDDGYIESLDALVQKISSAIPDAPVSETLQEQLDKGVKELIGSGDFQSEVRSWLGDVASFSVLSLDEMATANGDSSVQPPILFAISIKDSAAAVDFFTTGFENTNNEFTTSTEGDYTVITQTSARDRAVIAVGSDVLFLGRSLADLPINGQSESLAASASFNDTLGLLPEPDYNITGYLNLGDFLQAMMAAQSENMEAPEMAMMESLAPLFTDFPAQAFGLTVLDGRSLTIDFASPFGALLERYAEFGLPTALNSPIDPAFAARIPAGVPLLIHSTDLGLTLSNSIQSFRMQAEMMSSSMTTGGMSSDELEQGLAQVGFVVRGLTGLDLETELLPALQGDYALYLGLNAALANATSPAQVMRQLPVEFGLVTEISDPAIGTTIITNVRETARSAGGETLTTSNETIAGANVLVLTVQDRNTPFPIEIVIGSNNEVFFIGTRAAAEVSLGASGGLPTDPSYVEAGNYLLSTPNVVFYLASAGLQPLSDIIPMLGGSAGDARSFNALFEILSTASISSTFDDQVQRGRAVWTLPE